MKKECSHQVGQEPACMLAAAVYTIKVLGGILPENLQPTSAVALETARRMVGASGLLDGQYPDDAADLSVPASGGWYFGCNDTGECKSLVTK